MRKCFVNYNALTQVSFIHLVHKPSLSACFCQARSKVLGRQKCWMNPAGRQARRETCPPPQVRLAGEKGDCDEDPRILLEFIEGGMLKGGR